jgi:molecular chaperone GrpE
MSRQAAANGAEKSKESKNGAKSKKEKETLAAAEKISSDEQEVDQELSGISSDAENNPSQPADTSEEDGRVEVKVESDENENEAEETELDASDESSDEDEDEAQPETEEERYQREILELNEKYVRLAAEFENFKKRTNQEMQSRFKFASQPLAVALISGLDSLERAIDQAKQAIEEEDIKHFKEFISGIDLVKQQFYDAFKNNHIERTFPKGDLFDPNIHEAMGVIESEEIEPDHIAEVFQAGYYLHDRVVRPAMVQVAKKK